MLIAHVRCGAEARLRKRLEPGWPIQVVECAGVDELSDLAQKSSSARIASSRATGKWTHNRPEARRITACGARGLWARVWRDGSGPRGRQRVDRRAWRRTNSRDGCQVLHSRQRSRMDRERHSPPMCASGRAFECRCRHADNVRKAHYSSIAGRLSKLGTSTW